MAPGIPHSMLPADVEAEWVSDNGEVKEAALWSPMLATASRRATVIGPGGLATLTDELETEAAAMAAELEELAAAAGIARADAALLRAAGRL